MTDLFHTIVIGAGSGGMTAAIGLAGLGRQVAFIEGNHVGGDCTNVGCMPSKTLSHLAKHFKPGMNPDEALHEVTRKRDTLRDKETEEVKHLQEAIRVIQRELGVTTIFVTHDLGEAMTMSDRMALLLNGEIVALDKPEALFHRPRSLAAARFMGVSTFLSGDQLSGKNEAAAGSSEKLFAIRPEHILIQKEACKNSMQGVVSDCVFRGEYVEYQVAVGEVSVRARMPMPAPMFPHGEQVYVEFPSEHLFEIQG